jgi:hypothetical protein
MAKLPDNIGKTASDEIARRRKLRNWAMLAVLAALSALFYAITFVKMSH